MGWLIDFGLSIGGKIPTDVLVIGSASQGIIGTNVIGIDTMLADYSDRVVEVRTTRTSDRVSGPLTTFNAGTATVKLLDLSVESEYKIEVQGTLLLGKYIMGHDILRPECAGLIVTG